MTQEQLNKYIELSDVFQNKCELICKHLKPLDWKYGILYKFEIDEEWKTLNFDFDKILNIEKYE